jgi:hypothetical protein
MAAIEFGSVSSVGVPPHVPAGGGVPPLLLLLLHATTSAQPTTTIPEEKRACARMIDQSTRRAPDSRTHRV